ncbi:MAG: T9SS type A sorting domain-containing protein [Saprospiraceae bacterium]|nr:T9SS type A sorting domain-containing protein [Saprospiraceae bacterium]
MDGLNDFVAINSPLVGYKPFTIEVWFKSENVGTTVCSSTDLNGFKWLFSWVGELLGVGECDGKLALVYQPLNGAGNHFIQNLPVKKIDDQKWHHLAIGYDNQTGGTIWFDGTLLMSLGNNQLTFSEFYRIGSKFDQQGINWKGPVDEFRIWNYKRSSEEIRKQYQCRLFGNEKDLIAYYTMEHGIPGGNNTGISLLKDFSIKNNSGRLTNFSLNTDTSNFVCSDSTQLDTLCQDSLCRLDFTFEVTTCTSVNFMANADYYPGNQNIEYFWEGQDFSFTSNSPNPSFIFDGSQSEYEICLTAISQYCNKTICKKIGITKPGPPVFKNCPDQVTLFGCSAEYELNVEAIDPCTNFSPFLFSFKRSDLKNFNEPYPLGQTKVYFFATTLSGLSDSCVVDIFVKDTVPPVCNSQIIELYLNGQGKAAVETDQLKGQFYDNCGKVIYENVKTSFSCDNVNKETKFNFKIRDESENTTSCSFPVLVKDTFIPQIFVRDTTVTADETGGAVVNYSVNMADNCPGTTLTCSMPSGSQFPCGTNIVQCTATDISGNTSSSFFYVNVIDCEDCCKNSEKFQLLLEQDITIEAQTNQSGACVVQLYPPKLKECQFVTQLMWDDGTITNGLFPDSLDFIHEYFQPGTYDICVRITEDKDRKCFIGEICKTISVNEDCNIVSGTVHNLFQKISLAPNPVYNEFYLHSEAKVEKGTIHDITGRTVVVIKDMSSQIIDVSFLSPGIYWLSLTLHDGSTKNLSFIKQ